MFKDVTSVYGKVKRLKIVKMLASSGFCQTGFNYAAGQRMENLARPALIWPADNLTCQDTLKPSLPVWLKLKGPRAKSIIFQSKLPRNPFALTKIGERSTVPLHDDSS